MASRQRKVTPGGTRVPQTHDVETRDIETRDVETRPIRDTGRTATVNLPFVTATVRAPEVRLPSRADLDHATHLVRGMLPSGKQVLYYGGLAVTAAAGLIEWPVAAAIGLGVALASRGEAGPEPRERVAASS